LTTRAGAQVVEQKPSPSVFTLVGMGVSIALCIAVGLVVGVWLDSVTHRSPLFSLVGLLVGIVFAVVTAYVQIKKFL
jgi:F0F1-type ATP synthase assembly protein I